MARVGVSNRFCYNPPMDKASTHNQIITDVTQATWSHLWHNDRAKLIISLNLTLIATIFLFRYGIGVMIMAPAAVFSVWYRHASLQLQAQFMRQFAAANGFIYYPDESPAHLAGSAFSIGSDKTYTDLVKGFIDDLPFEYFAYNYTINTGRNRSAYTITVLTIELGHDMPNVYAQSLRVGQASSLSQELSAKMDTALGVPILSLGTEFDKYYQVRITPGAETETLQIFEPDLMANLIDQPVHFDFELCDRTLYIYNEGHVTKKAILDSLIAFARTFAARFERETSNLDYDPGQEK